MSPAFEVPGRLGGPLKGVDWVVEYGEVLVVELKVIKVKIV